MVGGLEHFLANFKGFEDHFILIGGTACDLWMGDFGLTFRGRKTWTSFCLPTRFRQRSSSGFGHSSVRGSMEVLSKAKHGRRSIASRIPRTLDIPQ